MIHFKLLRKMWKRYRAQVEEVKFFAFLDAHEEEILEEIRNAMFLNTKDVIASPYSVVREINEYGKTIYHRRKPQVSRHQR